MSTHLLSVTALHKSYQSRALLQDVTFGLDRGMRVGIIGDNGSGKSTLLKCIAGIDTVDSGHIALRQGTEVAYLPQVPNLGSGPVQAVLEAPFATLLHTIADYESSLARGEQPPEDALETIERLGGWNVQHRIDQAARNLGVESLTALCDELSGGQKKRVALAQLVLRDPDLILLDEPTNHLDTDTVAWLETWLRQSRGAALVVTHDRAFLDAIAQQMAELHNGQLRMYPGNYADFLEARAALDAVDERTVSRRAQVIKTELEWARRGPKARTTKSQARLDRLDVTMAEQQAAPSTRRVADINFGQAPRLGNTILELDEATVSYDAGPVFAPLTFKLVAKERWGIIGPNGAGKTSFLRMVAQELPLSSGKATYGVNTKIAYFDQHRVSLPPTAAVREVLVPEGGDTVFVQGKPVHVASYLQRFAFSAGYGQMRVEQLSGGEKNRLALARFLLQEANLLLLDEPTNDLDLVTLNVLESALMSFSGCVLVVSHDRRFLDKTATGIMAFDPKPNGQVAVSLHQGGFTEYQRERAAAKAPSAAAPSTQALLPPKENAASGRKLSWAEKRELEAIMPRIEEAEQRLATLQDQLADPALWSRDPEYGKQLQLELDTHQEAIGQLYKRWEALSKRAGS